MPLFGAFSGGGIDTSDATATAADISPGKTAYVNGIKIIGLSYDGSSPSLAAQKSTDIKIANPSASTGWYWLNLDGTPRQYWIDMDFEGGGWVLVASHPSGISIPSLTYSQAAQSYSYNGSPGFSIGTSNPSSYATWMGLNGWNSIVTANSAGRNFIYFASSSATSLSGSHSRRTRWKWNGWTSSFGWSGVNTVVNDIGGVTPGLYSYHIANGYSFTTYDADQDGYSGANCSSFYNNSPWWYGSCWDGSFWGSNGASGYQNSSYWTGSAGDYYGYGAMYVK